MKVNSIEELQNILLEEVGVQGLIDTIEEVTGEQVELEID